jgi:phosphoglucomutase
MAVCILRSHRYGTSSDSYALGTFFTRFDFENVDSDGAKKLTAGLAAKIGESSFVGSEISGRKVTDAGDFSYTDPVDGSVAKNQGLYVKFDDGSRFVVRLSGTGSSGATIRLYIEKHTSVSSSVNLVLDTQADDHTG